MKMYANIYYFYRTALMRTVRLLIFSLLLFLIIVNLLHKTPSMSLQAIFNFFLMLEVFFHYKVSNSIPSVSLSQNNGRDIFHSFTLPALSGFIIRPNTTLIIKALLTYPQIKNFLQKANITHKELVFHDLPKDTLAKKAFEVAQLSNGRFVTTVDILVAYLVLTEEKTKLLFAKQLKAEDIQTLARWIKTAFPKEENPPKVRVRFDGGGIGETLVSGWTPETKKYTTSFTSYALREEPLLLGRETEFKTMVESLLKVENNNVLLVGDIGSGKENLVRALAYQSFEGSIGRGLDYHRILQLLVGPFTAGVGNRSDLEVRLQDIVAEISHANDVILYIPDFQNIMGASSYNLDLSGAILPYLKGGSLPAIATMTTGSYKTYMQHSPLQEAFTVILLTEPDKQTSIQMVLAEASSIEKKYGVIVSYRSIIRAIDLANRFFQDAALPGSAISLLETVANAISLSPHVSYFDHTKQKMLLEEQVIQKVEEAVHVVIAQPTGGEKDLLLNLEGKLHERVIGQDVAIIAISEAMRRIRSGMQTTDRPISFLFLGPTGVGKTETAKTLADLYYGGEKKMIRLDMSEYTDEAGLKRLLGAPPGEGNERGELTDKIHDNPAALILLDEFEKAHPKIHNLFLQVLDDGRLTDNKGITVSFRNSIIIATSNAGSEYIREEVAKGTPVNKEFQQHLLEYLQTKAIFRPELLNRFDDVVTFKPLGEAEIMQVIELLVQHLQKNLAEQDITLVLADAVVGKIAKEGFDKDFGARPLKRYIQDNIEDKIAQKKLTNELTRGKKATFSVDGAGNLTLTVS